MYVEEIFLRGFRCFDELYLDLRGQSGSPRRWMVILGENGVGKSTVLQAVGLCLAGVETGSEFLYRMGDHQPTKAGTNTKAVLALTVRTSRPASGSERDGRYVLAYAIPPRGRRMATASPRGLPLRGGRPVRHPGRLPKSGDGDPGFACGYGPMRRLAGSEPDWVLPESEAGPMVTLFDSAAPLRSVTQWLRRVHYDSVGARNSRERRLAGARLKTMEKALIAFLPEVEAVEVSSDEVRFRTPFGALPAEALSDGYRGMLAWVLDMLGHLTVAYPEADDITQCAGVVLIDELDAHLHPAWQREISLKLRETFPNLQFIVGTHSPLIAEGAEEGEIVVLRREGAGVVAEVGLPSVQGWRADQVLTSGLFDLPTTRGPSTERQLARRDELLSKRHRTPKEELEFQRLTVDLDSRLPPPGETAEAREAQARCEELIQALAQHLPEDDPVLRSIRLAGARRRRRRPGDQS